MGLATTISQFFSPIDNIIFVSLNTCNLLQDKISGRYNYKNNESNSEKHL